MYGTSQSIPDRSMVAELAGCFVSSLYTTNKSEESNGTVPTNQGDMTDIQKTGKGYHRELSVSNMKWCTMDDIRNKLWQCKKNIEQEHTTLLLNWCSLQSTMYC